MSDVRRVFWVQAIRAFLYGFSSILIGASLAESGLDALAVGAVFTAMRDDSRDAEVLHQSSPR